MSPVHPGEPSRAQPARPSANAAPTTGLITGTVQVTGGGSGSVAETVVVYIEHIDRRFQPLKRPRQMLQQGKAFVPKLIAITRGSTVDFPNADHLAHNVFSLSIGNTFDLGLYSAGTSKPVTFENTGIVDVYCNIHSSMWAQILVLENPFYTTPDSSGRFALPRLPPGTYTVVAWATGANQGTRQPVTVVAGKTQDLHLVIEPGASSKPHLNKFNAPYPRPY